MTVGYCLYHHRWIEAEELHNKNCRDKNGKKKRCKHLLKIKSTKDKYHNPNKGGVRR